ncbi:MAG: hypothetical protein CV087_11035 [Candidatus Brocadia sp. WS118]|nr:MAG: hypothetical protein CV087_11035 [Candidatus Brocadia sp. WS118]
MRKILFILISLTIFNFYSCEKNKDSLIVNSPIPVATKWERIKSFPEIDVYDIIAYEPDEYYVLAGFVYFSHDSGESWQEIYSNIIVNTLDVNVFTQQIFISSFALQNGWLLYSADIGKTWTPPDSFPVNPFIRDFAFTTAGKIYAASSESDESLGGLYYSTDGGKKWHSTSISKEISVWKILLAENDDIYLSISEYQNDLSIRTGLLKSTDNAQTWVYMNPPSQPQFIRCMKFNHSALLFAGTSFGTGIFSSPDSGKTWISRGLEGYDIYDLEIDLTDNIYVVAYNHELNQSLFFYSDDDGESWINMNEGLPSGEIWALEIISQESLLAGTSKGLYKIKITDLVLD